MNDMNEVFTKKGFWELGTKIEAFFGFGPSAARIGIGGIGGVLRDDCHVSPEERHFQLFHLAKMQPIATMQHVKCGQV